MTHKLSDAVHVYAEAARSDPRITLGDVINTMQAETALRDWAEGIAFDRDSAQQELLRTFPHLQASVP